jgi:predicted nucleic acid-binding protein
MATKREAYLDTSAFIAFVDRSDTHHERFRLLFSKPPSIVSTTLVIAEGHGWFLRRYDRTRALQFLALIEELKPLQIVTVGTAELMAASKIMRKYSDQDLTVTDAVGLHIMRERKIKRCWSTDFHLGLAGATLAINES